MARLIDMKTNASKRVLAAALTAGVLWPGAALAQDQETIRLDEIEIKASADGVTETTAGPVQGYRALSAGSATRTDTPIEEIPQAITVLPRQLLEDQAAVSINEALRNASNVQAVDSRIIGNVDQSPLRIRGFKADQWIDGYAGNLFLSGDHDSLVNLERIEVLKGPNAVLYGGGAGAPLGGVVNLISKLPTATASYDFGATFGSYGYWSPQFDINQPLNSDGTVLFRMTGQYTRADSFIDVLESDRFSFNPTLTLTNNDDTSLTVQFFYSRHEQQAYSGLPVVGTIQGDYRVRRELYFGDPAIPDSTSEIYGTTVTFEHEFNEVWSTSIKGRWSESEMAQPSQAAFLDATGTGGTPILPPSTFDVSNLIHRDAQEEFSINPTLQARFAWGPSDNTVLFGGDYAHVSEQVSMVADTLGNMCFAFGLGCPPTLVDLQNPTFPAFVFPVAGVGEGATYFDGDLSFETHGVYGQVQSTLYDRIHLLVGGRVGTLDITYEERALAPPATFVTDETRFLPRVGAVVDVVQGLSLYAGYSEGMRWVPFSQTFARPKPELSKSLDAGIKFNLDDALTGTVSVFQIDRENVPYQIAFGLGALSEQRSRGFEADVVYQPDANWSVLASYGYTDATFESTTPAAPAGNRLPMVPEHSGRLWVNYAFDNQFSGWSLGGGVYAASDQFVDSANTWSTGAYFTVDAKIGYEVENVRVSLAVKNLTGEEYFTPYTWFGGQVAPGEPRMVYGQVGYRF
ncbi:TonB-dependent siderophore receptor [Zavarzinia sp. CC-PAN008]|uniref:TonB-dependent siderophore receptor n=1 Tax=Zavarzinia sp. CC-PAN008 TaxID=3243332 RepID=UPI003F745283